MLKYNWFPEKISNNKGLGGKYTDRKQIKDLT